MPEWSEARVKSFIVSLIRSGSRRWPPRYETLNEAKTEKKINVKSGRLAQHYQCNMCKNEFTSKDVEVDHIVPIANIDGFTTWDSFVEALFCEKDNLQVVCRPCHAQKTKLEKTIRKKEKIETTSKGTRRGRKRSG